MIFLMYLNNYVDRNVKAYLCYIIKVAMSQTTIASASKCHDNTPVCKGKIKTGD